MFTKHGHTNTPRAKDKHEPLTWPPPSQCQCQRQAPGAPPLQPRRHVPGDRAAGAVTHLCRRARPSPAAAVSSRRARPPSSRQALLALAAPDPTTLGRGRVGATAGLGTRAGTPVMPRQLAAAAALAARRRHPRRSAAIDAVLRSWRASMPAGRHCIDTSALLLVLAARAEAATSARLGTTGRLRQ